MPHFWRSINKQHWPCEEGRVTVYLLIPHNRYEVSTPLLERDINLADTIRSELEIINRSRRISSSPWEIFTSKGDLATLRFFVEDHLYPVAASRGLISCSWHCCFQIFMRSSACESKIPLNRQLPANAHWLI